MTHRQSTLIPHCVTAPLDATCAANRAAFTAIKPFVARRSGSRIPFLACHSTILLRDKALSGAFTNGVKFNSQMPGCVLGRHTRPAASPQERRVGYISAACNNDGSPCNTSGAWRVPGAWRECLATADGRPWWIDHFCCTGTGLDKGVSDEFDY